MADTSRSGDSWVDGIMSAMMAAAFVVVILPMFPAFRNMDMYAQTQMYEGTTYSEIIDVTGIEEKKEFSPGLSWAHITNIGLHNAIVLINGDEDDLPFTIYPGELITVGRLGAMRRISSITLSSPHNTIVRLICEY